MPVKIIIIVDIYDIKMDYVLLRLLLLLFVVLFCV